MKVFPYYSTRPSDSDVYHDYGDCPTGQQASWQHKAQGTNGYRKCEVCVGMDLAPDSTTGPPISERALPVASSR